MVHFIHNLSKQFVQRGEERKAQKVKPEFDKPKADEGKLKQPKGQQLAKPAVMPPLEQKPLGKIMPPQQLQQPLQEIQKRGQQFTKEEPQPEKATKRERVGQESSVSELMSDVALGCPHCAEALGLLSSHFVVSSRCFFNKKVLISCCCFFSPLFFSLFPPFSPPTKRSIRLRFRLPNGGCT